MTVGLFASLLNLGREVAGHARDKANEHVRMEDGRTLFLSDWALSSAIGALGRRVAAAAAIQAVQDGPGYRITGKAGGKSVSALVVLQSIRFKNGRLAVEVGTPAGLELEARPVASFFLSVVGRLFGGRWLGERVFSLVKPQGLTWDGATARYEVELDSVPVAGKRLAAIEGDARVTRGTGGLLVAFDDPGVAAQVGATLSMVVWDVLREKLDGWLKEGQPT